MWVKSLLFSFPSSEHKYTTSVFGVLKLFWYLDLYFVISPLASCHQTHSLTGHTAITLPTDSSLKRRLSEGSQRFHNHGEGPYQGPLQVESYWCLPTPVPYDLCVGVPISHLLVIQLGSAWCLYSVFNVKALKGAFNQKKVLVGDFSVIVKSLGTFK